MTADYVLITGAMKNVGDFLIADRGRELFAAVRPDRTTVEWTRFDPMQDRLATLNSARAVVLLGGPAYAQHFYPGIYPLPLADLRVPVVTVALGWAGQPMHRPDDFRFTTESLDALRAMQHAFPLSARDLVTARILQNHGLRDVAMTGCTVWYHRPSIGKPFTLADPVRHVVVTTGARRRLYLQNVSLLHHVRRWFPDAQAYCVFHRGIRRDRYTPAVTSLLNQGLAAVARRLHFEVVDASYDVSRISFYDSCDVHVGYRVHAHLYFLSLRKPSFLLQEDGRGIGVTTSLDLPDISATAPRALAMLERNIRENLNSELPRFQAAGERIDRTWSTMHTHLSSLP